MSVATDRDTSRKCAECCTQVLECLHFSTMEAVLWCVLAAVPVVVCLRYFRVSVILCSWLYDLGLVFLRFGAFWAKATAVVFCILLGSLSTTG